MFWSKFQAQMMRWTIQSVVVTNILVQSIEVHLRRLSYAVLHQQRWCWKWSRCKYYVNCWENTEIELMQCVIENMQIISERNKLRSMLSSLRNCENGTQCFAYNTGILSLRTKRRTVDCLITQRQVTRRSMVYIHFECLKFEFIPTTGSVLLNQNKRV